MKSFKDYIIENNNIDIKYIGNGQYIINLKGQKIGQAFITKYGPNYTLSAIDIDEDKQRKGYGTMLLSRIANDLKELGVKTLSSSNEGSGTVQMLDKVFGRNNVKHYRGNEEISYEEAIKIMDEDFGYTRSVANLRGIKDPRPWARDQPIGERRKMKIYKFDKIIKEAMPKDDKFSGNCGMYAIALAKNALDNNKKPVIVISTNTNDLDELMYGEPNIYHVATEIDGVLYDGSGQISEDILGKYAYNIYGDANPKILFLEFNNDVIKMIQQQTNWDTQWQEYYKEIKDPRPWARDQPIGKKRNENI